MKLENAFGIISKQSPCPHDNADTSLGNGKVWARCEDCGATFPQDKWERSRDAAKDFDDAMIAIRSAVSNVEVRGCALLRSPA